MYEEIILSFFMKYILIFTIKGNKIFVFMISKYPFAILTYVTKQAVFVLTWM